MSNFDLQSSEIKDLALALSNVQSKLTGALKDSTNPFFKSKYADLESVWEACRELLSANKIAVIQTTDGDANHDVLITTLVHSSGQWIRGRLKLTPTKQDPQAMGSAITYARRYALAAIIGVVQVDDDAEAAMGRKKDAQNKAEAIQAQVQPREPGDDTPTCERCNAEMKRTQKNNAWFCPNFSDKKNGDHSYFKDAV